ncbi:MAG: hypothetical protein LBV72_00015 [Tannerella sp.]|jgi:hypothetical protein|nr:hypothetical protein [Tannerella sp.]
MKQLYQSYWAARKRLQTEEATVSYLDTTNDTKYLKLFQKGKITAEEVAKKNHEEGLHYEVTILAEEKPISFLEIVHENNYIGVTFLDEVGRKYLKYQFKEVEPLKKLFLHEVWYYNYLSEDAINEDYRIHFAFDQEGNASYRKYDEINEKTLDYESKEPLDVSGLYEDYPEFGNYERLIKVERNMPLLDDMNNI